MEEMSRGMQQKVAIARALLTSPVLLLLDEPTTGLDPRSKKDVQRLVLSLREEHDATVVLTTHDMDEADRLCDRLAVLDRGRVIALDTPDHLKQAGGSTGGRVHASDERTSGGCVSVAIRTRELNTAFAFFERNWNLTRRYIGWEVVWIVYSLVNALTILFIAAATEQITGQQVDTHFFVLYLLIGTTMWSYLSAVFDVVAETIAWERWEGTIEYTLMAPVRRSLHLIGTCLVRGHLFGRTRAGDFRGGGGDVRCQSRPMPTWRRPWSWWRWQRERDRAGHRRRGAAAAVHRARGADDVRDPLELAADLGGIRAGRGAAELAAGAGAAVADDVRAALGAGGAAGGRAAVSGGRRPAGFDRDGRGAGAGGLLIFRAAERYARRTGRLKRSG